MWAIVSSMLTIGVLTLGVKLAAFAKDVIVAGNFGTADAMDAFLLAFLIPALTSSIFAAGMPDALLPAYAEQRERQSRASADQLAAACFRWYAGALALVMLALWAVSPWLVPALAPKFSPEKLALTQHLFVLLLPFGFLVGLTYHFNSWLQANHRFALAAAAPAIIPAVTLLALLTAGGTLGIYSLVWGSLIGAALQLALLIRAVRQESHASLFTAPATPESRRVVRESLPLIAGGVLMCGMPMVDQIMAAWLPAGSVAVLSYAEKVCSIVLSLAAISAGQALYPWLAEQAGRRDWMGLHRTIIKYAGLIAGASLPAVAVLWLGAPLIIQLLLERKAFTPEDTARVAAVLQCSALQIPFYIAAVLASRVIMSMRAGKFMLLTTVVNLAANIALNLLFMRWLGARGLALATACVYALSAAMLYTWILRRLPRLAREERPVF
jgi:putative peptidoglycan lipid II flippase